MISNCTGSRPGSQYGKCIPPILEKCLWEAFGMRLGPMLFCAGCYPPDKFVHASQTFHWEAFQRVME